MDRPWFQFTTRDWLDNKELRRCSPLARSVLIDLMCLAHEGVPYGYVADRVGPLQEQFLASRCVVTIKQLRASILELQASERVKKTDSGTVFVPRMVRDEEVRLKRAAGGVESNKNPYVPRKKDTHEGYPSDYPSDANQGHPPSRTRVHVASDSVFVSSSESTERTELSNGARGNLKAEIAKKFDDGFWPVVWAKVGIGAARKAWAIKVPDLETADLVILAAERQGPRLLSEALVRGGSVLHPSTWLNAERWKDEPLKTLQVQHNGISSSRFIDGISTPEEIEKERQELRKAKEEMGWLKGFSK
ncbi:MAG: hypothetical protein NVS9B4_00420 [Candidatus Acidiferrum sp.]